jgi:phosphatidylinositol alpha-mannosyltransferase
MASEPGLKIGLVLDTSLDPTDGVQQYVLRLGEWLSKNGHEVHYLVGETKQRSLPNLHSLAKNISVKFNGNRTTIPLPTSRKRLGAFLNKHNFDVLHVQIPHSPFMAQRLILEASDNTAIIGTFHVAPYGRMASTGNRVLGIWLRTSIKRFDNVISVSSAAAEFAESTFKIKSIIVPNIIDYQIFHNVKTVKKFKKELNILFLGRLVERKGCQVLLEAGAILSKNKSLPAFKITICGRGYLEKTLMKYVTDNNLNQIVRFKGFISEEQKPEYYASADISVFPSSSGESFGIVLLEAMASGSSVVLAGDNPGYRTVMSPQPDLLFPAKNASQLALKIEKYMLNVSERRKMAKWGEIYSAGFDTNTVGPKILDIYTQALLKRRSQ